MANQHDMIEMLPVTFDNAKTIRYLREKGVLYDGVYCHSCNVWMSQIRDASRKCDKYSWRCKRCRTKMSIRADSFWDTLKKPLNVALWILYLFANNVQLCAAEDMLCNSITDNTIRDYYNFFRDLMSQHLLANPVSLGGPGRLVQIDESYFGGTRKYDRGRRVRDGFWVFGMIDVYTKKVAVFLVEDRTKETLVGLIESFILPNTMVHSDGWMAYRELGTGAIPYLHEWVNHSENYVDPATGAHTQEIEGFWSHAKMSWKRSRGMSESMRLPYLDEVAFRWNNKHEDIFSLLLSLMMEYYPVNNIPLSPEIIATKPRIRY